LDPTGGRVVSYLVGGKEVLAAESHSATSTYRSALLAPWPNRVAHGRWHWEGEDLQLPVNEQPPGNALHGLVAFAPFEVTELGDHRARMVHDLDSTAGYPFPLRVEASYALTDGGLECQLAAVASGDRPTPVALGVHPYLSTRGPVDDVELCVPGDQLVQVDARWEQLGHLDVSRTGLDLREGRRIGDQDIDACWTDLRRDADGRVHCRVVLPDGDAVAVWGGSTARYVVAYTSHTLPGELRRTSLAVEPCTAPANALRSGADLDVLVPGESLALEWGLRPSWLSG
jgi:aldose 1-epimerase